MFHAFARLTVLCLFAKMLWPANVMAQEPQSRPESPLEIITLGDSITKGVRPGVKPDQTFAALLEADLKARGVKARVTNVGIGGERTDGALARLDRDVLAKKPRLVTIMYGTNDSYVDRGKSDSRLTLEEYRGNLKQLLEQIRAAGAL